MLISLQDLLNWQLSSNVEPDPHLSLGNKRNVGFIRILRRLKYKEAHPIVSEKKGVEKGLEGEEDSTGGRARDKEAFRDKKMALEVETETKKPWKRGKVVPEAKNTRL